MCIAIYKPAGKVISDETLLTCFKANKDGCGFAYINTSLTERKKIIIKKTLSFEVFLRQYKRALRTSPESPFLIHFRIKTHGPVNKENCHPFSIDDENVFIHNGIIMGVGTDPDKSDTRLFNEKVLKRLPKDWYTNPAICTLIQDFIGASKIVTMNIDGDVGIFNEDKGYWDGGIWFSNTTYKTYKSTYTSNTHYIVPNRKKTKFSFVQCSGCFRTFQVNSLTPYVGTYGVVEGYCTNCNSDLVSSGAAASMILTDTDAFVEDLNFEDTMIPEGYDTYM